MVKARLKAVVMLDWKEPYLAWKDYSVSRNQDEKEHSLEAKTNLRNPAVVDLMVVQVLQGGLD